MMAASSSSARSAALRWNNILDVRAFRAHLFDNPFAVRPEIIGKPTKSGQGSSGAPTEADARTIPSKSF
jgi:hypothetical protein